MFLDAFVSRFHVVPQGLLVRPPPLLRQCSTLCTFVTRVSSYLSSNQLRFIVFPRMFVSFPKQQLHVIDVLNSSTETIAAFGNPASLCFISWRGPVLGLTPSQTGRPDWPRGFPSPHAPPSTRGV